jgi:hypothetical protein
MRHRINTTGFFGFKTALELWITKASKITVVMLRGSYWLGEKRRLLLLLGMESFDKIGSQTLPTDSMRTLTEQIHKLNRKLEAEESLIQEICFGTEFKEDTNK